MSENNTVLFYKNEDLNIRVSFKAIDGLYKIGQLPGDVFPATEGSVDVAKLVYALKEVSNDPDCRDSYLVDDLLGRIAETFPGYR